MIYPDMSGFVGTGSVFKANRITYSQRSHLPRLVQGQLGVSKYPCIFFFVRVPMVKVGM
jgi:hypothetical protein